MVSRIKPYFLVFCLLIAGGAAISYILNFRFYQKTMDRLIQEDSRLHGLEVSIHARYWLDYSRLVVDVKSITPPANPESVLRCFFQLADEFSDRSFDEVILAYQRKSKWMLQGQSFAELGRKYGGSTSRELLLHLMVNLRLPDGRRLLSGKEAGYASLLENEMGANPGFDPKQGMNLSRESLLDSITDTP